MVWHELIDTLWNVNGIYLSHFGGHLLELIDTLWNVNQGICSLATCRRPWINRYIMECKYNWIVVNKGVVWELIDTLWNVNGGADLIFLAISSN